MPKLPKDVVADPRHEAVVKRFTDDVHPLWEQGTQNVPNVELSLALTAQIKLALRSKVAVQGLEQITRALAKEKRGLDALALKKPDSPQRERISRILLVANDGADRFNRECDTILFHYADRVLGCRIDVTGDALGTALFGQPKLVRAILIADKQATARIMLTLV